jgi:hypothetical protein
MGTVGDCKELLLRPRGLTAPDTLSDLDLPGPVLLTDGSLLFLFAGDGADSISTSTEGRLTPTPLKGSQANYVNVRFIHVRSGKYL